MSDIPPPQKYEPITIQLGNSGNALIYYPTSDLTYSSRLVDYVIASIVGKVQYGEAEGQDTGYLVPAGSTVTVAIGGV